MKSSLSFKGKVKTSNDTTTKRCTDNKGGPRASQRVWDQKLFIIYR